MIDTIDVQSLRGAVFAEAQATFGAEAVPELAKYAVTLNEELAHLSAAGSIIAISQAEHAFLCRHIAPQKVVHAGMSARSTAALPPSSPDSRRVLFVGNSYEPNIDGIRTFLREVWPAILARIPEARLAICGRVAADLAVPDVAGVDLIGPVEDLADAYREAAVAINPIRFGTGLSVKVIETLAMGRCMVSTPVGGRGFETAAAAGALEIVGLDDFADRICTLLLDPAARAAMEAAALDYARRALAPEVVHADLFNLVESRLFY
jgi:glycosyltransferase involved in cell wall biosynthesis